MRKTARQWLHQVRDNEIEPERETPFIRAVEAVEDVYLMLADVGEGLLNGDSRVMDTQSGLVFNRSGGSMTFECDGQQYDVRPPKPLSSDESPVEQCESLLEVEDELKDWWSRSHDVSFPIASLRGELLSALSQMSEAADEATLSDLKRDLYGNARKGALPMYFDRDGAGTEEDALSHFATTDRILEVYEAYSHLIASAARGTKDEWYLIGEREDNSFFMWQLPEDPTSGFRVEKDELVDEAYDQLEISGTVYDTRANASSLSTGARGSITANSNPCHVLGDACIQAHRKMGSLAKRITEKEAKLRLREKREAVLENLIEDMGLSDFATARFVRAERHSFSMRRKGIGDADFEDCEPFIRAVYDGVGLSQTFGSVEHMIENADGRHDLYNYAKELESVVLRNLKLKFEQRWEDVSVTSPEEAAQEYVEQAAEDADSLSVEVGETTVRFTEATQVDEREGIVLPKAGEVVLTDPHAGRRTIPLEAGRYTFHELEAKRA